LYAKTNVSTKKAPALGRTRFFKAYDNQSWSRRPASAPSKGPRQLVQIATANRASYFGVMEDINA
jgi:hypothetical protein